MLKLFQKFKKSPSSTATFFRFAGVGLMLSLIDILILYLLMELGFNAFLSRLLSLTSSMLVGYFFNRYFTFYHIEVGRALWDSVIRHFSVHGIGSALNIGMFLTTLTFANKLNLQGPIIELIPLIAVWIGGIAGLSFNFFFSRKIVFDNK